MPHCTNSGDKKTKLNRRNLCNECNIKANDDTAQDNQPVLPDGNKRLSQMSVNDLKSVIESIIQPLETKIDGIKAHLTKIVHDIASNKTSITELKDQCKQ